MPDTKVFRSWDDVLDGTLPDRPLNKRDFKNISDESHRHWMRDSSHLVRGKLFRFARQGKAYLLHLCEQAGTEYEKQDFTSECLRDAFALWLKKSIQRCTETGDAKGGARLSSSAEDLYDAFLNKWRTTKYYAGYDPIVDAMKKSEWKAIPEDLRSKLSYGGKVEPMRARLAMLCRELQLSVPEKTQWYLGCRKAGEVLGLSHVRANELINALVDRGIIKITEHSSFDVAAQEQKKANKYRYCLSLTGPDDIEESNGWGTSTLSDSRTILRCERCEMDDEVYDPFDLSRERVLKLKEEIDQKRVPPSEPTDTEIEETPSEIYDLRITPCCPYSYSRWCDLEDSHLSKKGISSEVL